MNQDREKLERIRKRAYQLWEHAGRRDGDDWAHWHAAEQEENAGGGGEDQHWHTAPSATPTAEEARSSGRQPRSAAPPGSTTPDAAPPRRAGTAVSDEMTPNPPPKKGAAPATPAAKAPVRKRASGTHAVKSPGPAGERPAPAVDAEEVPGDPAKAPLRKG